MGTVKSIDEALQRKRAMEQHRAILQKWGALGPMTKARFIRIHGSEYFAAMAIFEPKQVTQWTQQQL
jgi:hypothetical protein